MFLVYYRTGTYLKYNFYVKIQLFVTLKFDHDPDPDPRWFGSPDPYPDSDPH
jgi:hypothetical protein